MAVPHIPDDILQLFRNARTCIYSSKSAAIATLNDDFSKYLQALSGDEGVTSLYRYRDGEPLIARYNTVIDDVSTIGTAYGVVFMTEPDDDGRYSGRIEWFESDNEVTNDIIAHINRLDSENAEVQGRVVVAAPEVNGIVNIERRPILINGRAFEVKDIELAHSQVVMDDVLSGTVYANDITMEAVNDESEFSIDTVYIDPTSESYVIPENPTKYLVYNTTIFIYIAATDSTAAHYERYNLTESQAGTSSTLSHTSLLSDVVYIHQYLNEHIDMGMFSIS